MAEPNRDGTTDGIGEVIGGQYLRTKRIGKGSQGSVWECRELATGNRVACKSFPLSNNAAVDVYAELRALETVSGHPNVVRLLDFHVSATEIHIIMEYVAGGDLLTEIMQRGPLDEALASTVFRQLASAVAYCHSLGVMHRDIKPDNILLVRPVEEGGLNEGKQENDAGAPVTMTHVAAAAHAAATAAVETKRAEARTPLSDKTNVTAPAEEERGPLSAPPSPFATCNGGPAGRQAGRRSGAVHPMPLPLPPSRTAPPGALGENRVASEGDENRSPDPKNVLPPSATAPARSPAVAAPLQQIPRSLDAQAAAPALQAVSLAVTAKLASAAHCVGSQRRIWGVKLADFALSCQLSSGLAGGKKSDLGAGTRQYMAPEMDWGAYDLKADVWSLGITLCAILTGRLPTVDAQRLVGVETLPIDFSAPSWAGVSGQAKELVRLLLRVAPYQRPSAFQLLEHPWLNHSAVRRRDMATLCPAVMASPPGRKGVGNASAVVAGSCRTAMLRWMDGGVGRGDSKRGQLRG